MGLAALIASCSDDDRNNDTDNQHLVSPSMAVSISNTDGRQSPFTGILTIMRCKQLHILWKLCKRETVSFLRLLPGKGRKFP